LSATDLSAFLDARLAGGFHPNTVRKWLVMARTLSAWMYERQMLTAEALLEIRRIRPPVGSSSAVQPAPYARRDLRQLQAILAERWPRLSPTDARHWALKWREGRTSYKRIRCHAVRLQLNAVIALALDLGLRRREIFALDLDSVHYDNAYVVVWDDTGPWEGRARDVPFTDSARQAIYDWIEFRALLGVSHRRPWVALHGGPAVGEPMNRSTFEKLLRTYVGDGWTLKRLRDTCAVSWVKRGLPLEHLRQLLGQAALEDTLPYARMAGGDLSRGMKRLADMPAPVAR
jgi:integrase